jgi:hypothetical protein
MQLGVPDGCYQRALVGEFGTIRTQMRKDISNGPSVWYALCDTTPYSNSNSTCTFT